MILESHVIETICYIGYKRWGMVTLFYDKDNNCISEKRHMRNSFCNLMHSCNESAESCRQFYSTCLKEVDTHNGCFSMKCYNDLDAIIFPIMVDEEFVGTIIVSGLKLSKKKNLDKNIYIKLKSFGIDDTIINRNYDSIVPLNGSAEEYVKSFLKLIVEVVKVNFKIQNEILLLDKSNEKLRENHYLEKYENIIFKSTAMTRVFDLVGTLERSETTVLIEGETGTGKDLLAAAIHYNSPRKDKVFIIQNCSVFNNALLSSELFGHVKGAFTGAISDKKGLFRIADGGTLFLDEIGDMSIENQSNLLRILENGTYYQVGGTELQRVDVRIIAATNKKLHEQVKKNYFEKTFSIELMLFQLLCLLSERGRTI
ncbi:response regulator [Candidatus Scalindua japonica]|uniref:Response regulator n=1 Tax=Candidatus Scalindua japonica TaxID=1284222 RepID=A0A286TZD8_9BACT|nr:sigma 54-interacting transcriptional regulator [Candidatus Scalindua japonica]GAX61263.1 response regulator [Candidatus Scalindua japonica]